MAQESIKEKSVLTWRDLQVNVRIRNSSQGKWFPSRISKCCSQDSSGERSLTILKEVSGYTASGELAAIMGPRYSVFLLMNFTDRWLLHPDTHRLRYSGAGKTTLLAALARKLEITRGSITVDGQVLSRDVMNRISGYVPQFEAMPRSLTITEYAIFACALSRPNCSKEEREYTVQRLLMDLGLYSNKDTLISKLSGGEVKRLSLAVEIISEPMILFLDEPTTGLDSFSARRVIEALRVISSRGAIVLCTIHQPGMMLYELFDRVAWIADGRAVYFGDLANATNFFTSQGYECPPDYDQAEFYMKLISSPNYSDDAKCDDQVLGPNGIERISKAFARSPLSEIPETTMRIMDVDLTSQRQTSCIYQFAWLIWRLNLQKRREFFKNWSSWFSTLLALIALGVFYGRIDAHDQGGVQNARGVIYMTSCEIFFIGAYSVLHELPRDLCIYVREASLYYPGPYYIANVLLSLPRIITKALLFILMLYIVLIDAEHSVLSFLYYCLCACAAAACGMTYGIMVSSWILSVDIATTIMMPIDNTFIITSGVFYNLKALPIYLVYLKYGSIFFYLSEVLSILFWPSITNIECSDDPTLPCLSNGKEVLDDVGFQVSHFGWDIFGMVLLTIVMNVIGYLGVRRRRKTKAFF